MTSLLSSFSIITTITCEAVERGSRAEEASAPEEAPECACAQPAAQTSATASTRALTQSARAFHARSPNTLSTARNVRSGAWLTSVAARAV